MNKKFVFAVSAVLIFSMLSLGIMFVENGLAISFPDMPDPCPFVFPNDPPWEGDVGVPVYFWAKVVFMDYPPFHWEWRFSKTEGGPEVPDEIIVTNTTIEPEWGFNHMFDNSCNYTVTIKVTNDQGQNACWPLLKPFKNNYVLIGYDGDLDPIEPNIKRIQGAEFNCKVRFWNRDETYEVPGGWHAKVYWHGNPNLPIGSGDYMYDVPPDTFRDNFNIEIHPEARGLHWVKVVLDVDNICHESDEDNNEVWALHFYCGRIRVYLFCQL